MDTSFQIEDYFNEAISDNNPGSTSALQPLIQQSLITGFLTPSPPSSPLFQFVNTRFLTLIPTATAHSAWLAITNEEILTIEDLASLNGAPDDSILGQGRARIISMMCNGTPKAVTVAKFMTLLSDATAQVKRCKPKVQPSISSTSPLTPITAEEVVEYLRKSIERPGLASSREFILANILDTTATPFSLRPPAKLLEDHFHCPCGHKYKLVRHAGTHIPVWTSFQRHLKESHAASSIPDGPPPAIGSKRPPSVSAASLGRQVRPRSDRPDALASSVSPAAVPIRGNSLPPGLPRAATSTPSTPTAADPSPSL